MARTVGSPEHRSQPFATPRESLGGSVDAETAGALISATADIALVIDREGVVRDVSVSDLDLAELDARSWVGRPWRDTVTVDSKGKIDELLGAPSAKSASRWRQVNHPTPSGVDAPVRYSAIRLDQDGRTLAVGRDLRAIGLMQQRLVDAQQAMEREYARIRSVETRYRLLFQLASEAVVIVDGLTNRIVDANPASTRILGVSPKRIIGQAFADLFDEGSAQAVQSLFAATRSAGRADDVHARTEEGKTSLLLSASLFRQESAAHLLIKLRPMAAEGASAPASASSLMQVIERLPEAFAVTDLTGRVLAANSAFLDLAQAPTEQQVKNQPISRWLGRPGLDVETLFNALRAHGSVRNFSTVLRGELDGLETVEIAAVLVEGGEIPCVGFSIRTNGWRQADRQFSGPELPSTEQFTDLVGRMPLKEMVRETTDIIERLCIEAALELTRDNRASAAEMLGLSRQSLYTKLRRFGLGDLESEPDDVKVN
ncbi:transcriptional regulator PpsR [Alsobacter sp. SYSU BS001988]